MRDRVPVCRHQCVLVPVRLLPSVIRRRRPLVRLVSAGIGVCLLLACSASSTVDLAARDHCERTAGVGRCLLRSGRWVAIGSINGTTSTSLTTTSTTTAVTTTTAARSTTMPSTTTATAPPTTRVDIGRFAGTWAGHSRELILGGDGHFVVEARLYVDCASSPPPCDSFQGNTIIPGLHADGVITTTRGNRAFGRIRHTTDPADVPIGPISLSLDPASDTLTTQPGNLYLCGPSAAPGSCGA
ncbi:MAG: hypothetical protein JWN46_139 [Acidimicrobiales bacterium]|nr:hypothetical protein [Acidimicrobiales bacterium]